MANLFRQIREERGLFKDESALLPDFLPEELPGREREMRELAFCLKPAAEGSQPRHAALVGPPGTGKTSSARLVLKHLCEYSSRPLAIYINCWEIPSRFGVLSAIADALGEPMPRRGIAADEIFLRVVEIAKKEGRVPVIVLDEADRLVAQPGGEKVLYDLCRAGEVQSLKTGVVAIANDESFSAKLDARIRSSFPQSVLSFKPYSMPQLKEIAGQRARLAFFESAVHPDVVPLCAAIAYKNGGDARLALSLLFSAGKIAERENASCVNVSHVRQAQPSAIPASKTKAERAVFGMDALDQEIVKAVKEAGKGGIESGRLYQLLSGIAKERAIRGRIKRLEESGVLSCQDMQLKHGRSRMIRLKEPK
ncbi:MAG: AAA family ATPase [Candidatus Micrarchaeota archaeon]|nr:AAA family ATPase [Candidatus Micrarchaeota archaeon]